jgi:tetratricopeptide (TPR) repeat protein
MFNTRIGWLIITLITISLNTYSQQSPLAEQLEQADYLFANRQYEAAIKEYQRYIFFSGSDDVDVLLKVARGLFEMGSYDLSLQYYDQIYYLSEEPEIKFQSRLQEVIYNMKQQNYNQALTGLFTLNTSYYELYPQMIDFLFALCYYGQEDFNKAEEYFLKITASEPEATEKIRSIFSNEKQFYKPNPQTLSYLSLFIPGMGQMVAGEYKEGINSFILVGGLATAAVVVAIRYSFIDAVFTILPWYQRYLIGGSNKAEKLAMRKLEQNRNEIYHDIIEILEPFRENFELKKTL